VPTVLTPWGIPSIIEPGELPEVSFDMKYPNAPCILKPL